MLDFVKLQPFKYYYCFDVNHNNVEKTIVKYTNIDFSLTVWPNANSLIYNNINFIQHMVNNMIDLNKFEGTTTNPYTIFNKAAKYYKSGLCIIDGGYKLSFQDIYNIPNRSDKDLYKKYYKIQNYLRSIYGDNKYFNTVKYYDKMFYCLLIMKHQKIIPKCVFKFKIIPFIYN